MQDFNGMTLPTDETCGYLTDYKSGALCDLSIHKLRYQVFCKELNWVSVSNSKLEADQHDKDAIHISIYSSDKKVIGTTRILESSKPWMMSECFSHLLHNHVILQDESSIEVSRFAVDSQWRGVRLNNNLYVSDILLKAMFHYAILNNKSIIYAVISRAVLRFLLNKGVPVKNLGGFKLMPDGVSAAAICIDVKKMIGHSDKKCSRYLWYFSNAYHALSIKNIENITELQKLLIKQYESLLQVKELCA